MIVGGTSEGGADLIEGLPPYSATAGYVMRVKLLKNIKFVQRITNPPYKPTPIYKPKLKTCVDTYVQSVGTINYAE